MTIETKTSSTQTATSIVRCDKKDSDTEEIKSTYQTAASYPCLDQRKSSTLWSAREDPAPQWLIEEALNRGNQVCKEYDAIISELEEKLSDAKTELEEAHRRNCATKDKYKRALENAKQEARKENELLQEKIVTICTSLVEKFGPRALSENTSDACQAQIQKRSQRHRTLSNKLRKKLRATAATTSKLKRELAATSAALREKTAKYESVSKCFARLKQEMETTEMDLNNLIGENVALRKKIEDAREWMEAKVGKAQHEKSNAAQSRDMQRSRELTNLRKKAEEDFATITQLRNKLLRSESANANKGFLLNSYKSQLADCAREKERFTERIKSLENETNALRNNCAQLKAKISLVNGKKEMARTESEKSEPDTKERADKEKQTESKLNEKHENPMQQAKGKCEEALKTMKAKVNSVESVNTQYVMAIKDFLKKLHEYYSQRELEKSLNGTEASEREARETVCNILNMTPEQLSGFMKGTPSDTINTWLANLNKITSRTNFAESLATFLFKSTVKTIKT